MTILYYSTGQTPQYVVKYIRDVRTITKAQRIVLQKGFTLAYVVF